MSTGKKSPRSRRNPKDHGRGSPSGKKAAWRAVAAGAVDAAALRAPVVAFGYGPRAGEGLEGPARRLDQAFRKARIRYAIDVPRGVNYLRVSVNAGAAGRAQAVILALKNLDEGAGL